MKAVIFQPGSILQNRYRVLRKLGQGGFGQTFEVEDKGTIKVLKVLNLHKFHSLEKKEQALLFFQREFNILSQIDRPFIPKVEPDGYFTINDESSTFHCLLMEKIEGNNLEEWLQQNGNQTITAEIAIDWLKQLVKIVEYLHQKHCFHRDIKPQNIIIKPNGELVLIDFGAVREISNTYLTKIVEGREITAFVSPGYTPKEQMEGKALPQSDFYAIGRTIVHLLTGIHPIELDEDNSTGELIWRDKAPDIGDKLADLIDSLMAPFPGERPENTQVILDRLLKIKLSSESKLSNIRSKTNYLKSWKLIKYKRILTTLLTMVVVTTFVSWLRKLEIMQQWEFKAFDKLLELRPNEKLDGRILIIEAAEPTIKKYKSYPLSDTLLFQLLEKLEKYEPRVIGLNIIRDTPVEQSNNPVEGNKPTPLSSYWQQSNRLMVNCGLPTPSQTVGYAPPRGVPKNRIGFTNIVYDFDGTVRRQLISVPLIKRSLCQTKQSFSFRLAYSYLKAEGILPKNTSQGYITLGKATLKSLHQSPGSYQQKELGGFQILLNYRSRDTIAQTVTVTQVLEDDIDPNWVKDRLVIIGMNLQKNPQYSTPDGLKVPPVQLQAQMISQILSAALDGRPLLQMLPQWGEILWICGWSAVGSTLAWRRQQLLYWGLAGSAIALGGFSFILLVQGIWMPLIPPVLALIFTTGVGITTLHLINE